MWLWRDPAVWYAYFFEPKFYRTHCQEVWLGFRVGDARHGRVGLDGATCTTRHGSLAHRQIRRNTATTLPATLALSPGMGVYAEFCGISQIWRSTLWYVLIVPSGSRPSMVAATMSPF